VALPAGLGWREFRQPSSLAGLAESNFGPAYLLVEAATGRRARWQLLDGIYAGQPLFTSRLRANAQSGLRARTDHGKWSAALEAALTATLQDDLQDGTTAASQARLCLRNGGSISGSGWLDAAARPILILEDCFVRLWSNLQHMTHPDCYGSGGGCITLIGTGPMLST
jgi:hypothetical protein